MSRFPLKHPGFILPLFIVIMSGCAARLASGTFLRDQAELVVFSQTPQLLFDEQMPLLAWLMSFLFKATNYFILWPDLYKYLCLSLVLWALFDIGYVLTKKFHLAILGAFSVFFLPTFHTDMLSEVTHTAALLAATAMSTALLLRLRNNGATRKVFIGLGVWWLVGIFAKHTMVFVILAQIIAYALAFKPRRNVVLGLLKTLLVTALCALPFFVLLIIGKESIDSGMQEFLSPDGYKRGLVDLLTSIVGEGALYIIVAIVIIPCLFVRKRRQTLKTQSRITVDSNVGFLALTSFLILLWFVPFIILGDIAVFRDRWISPTLMLWGPLFAYSFLFFRDKIGQITSIIFSVLVCVIGLYAAAEPRLKVKSGSVDLDTWPIALMSEKLRADFPSISNYIAFDDNLVATLKYQDPRLNVYSVKTRNAFQTEAKGKFLLLRVADSPKLSLEPASCGAESLERLMIKPDVGWEYIVQICQKHSDL